MTLDIDNWIVCWTPASGPCSGIRDPPGAILVDRLGSDAHWDHRRFAFTSGACYAERRHMTHEAKVMLMFIDFHTCVVRDGIDPRLAHREFLKVGEYRRRISSDIDGADVAANEP
jgi:hypothetical protein